MVKRSVGALPLFEEPSLAPVDASDTEGRSFVELVRTFSELGQPSAAVQEGGINYLINEFWTAGQRQAHSIHEVSYRACFKPQLPEFFIKQIGRASCRE